MFTDRNKIHTHTHTYYTISSSMVKTTLGDWVPSVAHFKNETEDATNYSLDLKGRWFRGKGYIWAPEFYFDRKLMTTKSEGKNILPNIAYKGYYENLSSWLNRQPSQLLLWEDEVIRCYQPRLKNTTCVQILYII